MSGILARTKARLSSRGWTPELVVGFATLLMSPAIGVAMSTQKLAVYGGATGLTILLWIVAYNLAESISPPPASPAPSPPSSTRSPSTSIGVVQGPVIINQGGSLTSADPVMSPVQERLLEILAKHQRQFAASKLVVGRKDGKLHFDDDPSKAADLSVVADLYGSETPARQAEFERLVESMPPEYLRLIPEARWDSPFVVSVTEKGMTHLRK